MDHIQNVNRSALEQRIGAQSDHGLFGEGVVEYPLVFEKLGPMVRFHQERVSAYPDSLAALREGFAKFAVPSSDNSLQIELVVIEIPLLPRRNFDSTFGQIAIEIRHGAGQSIAGFHFGERFGDCP